MGLFDLFNRKKTNNVSVDIEHLPDNDQELEKLYNKYVYNTDDKSRKICDSIILKAYDLCEDKDDLSHWAVTKYYLSYGTKENQEKVYHYKAKCSFDKYIKALDRFVLSSSLSGEELLKKCPIFLPIDGNDNRFVYNENPQNYLDYYANALYNYYQENLTYLMEKVIDLLNKQLANNSICLSGFYMYKDLEQFFMFETKDYNNGIFEQTHEYTYNLNHYVKNKYATKEKDSRYNRRALEYDRMHKYALNTLKKVDYQTLLTKYETYKKVRQFIKEDRIVLRIVKEDHTNDIYFFEKVHRDFNEDRTFILLRNGKKYTFDAKSFGVHGSSKEFVTNRFAISMSYDYYFSEGDIFYSYTDEIHKLYKARETSEKE